jgi:hypothetical protein
MNETPMTDIIIMRSSTEIIAGRTPVNLPDL